MHVALAVRGGGGAAGAAATGRGCAPVPFGPHVSDGSRGGSAHDDARTGVAGRPWRPSYAS